MNEPIDLLARAAAKRQAGRTAAQQEARRAVDKRNKRLQELALRPPNGVTFGSGKPPKAA